MALARSDRPQTRGGRNAPTAGNTRSRDAAHVASVVQAKEELSEGRKKVTRMQDEAERSLEARMRRRSELEATV